MHVIPTQERGNCFCEWNGNVTDYSEYQLCMQVNSWIF